MRFRGLDLNHLVTLEVLLVERNLTRASARLNVTQPAVSNALTRLRVHFEDPLLERRGRVMYPTPFALSLLRQIQETLGSIQKIAMARPQFDAQTAARDYSIVASDYITTIVIGPLSSRVRNLAPHVRLRQYAINDEAIGLFWRGEIDAMILPDSGREVMKGFARKFLFLETFVCIAAKSNDAVPESLTPERYFSLPRVIPPHKKYWPEEFLSRGSEAPHALTMPFASIPMFVASSEYVAVVPTRLLALFDPMVELKRVALTTPISPIRFYAHTRSASQQDSFHCWMLDQLCQVAESGGAADAPTELRRAGEGG